MIIAEHFCSNMNWHTKSILFLNYLHLQFYIVGMIHSPFIGLSRFNLDRFVASICMHFNSWFSHFQIIRYFFSCRVHVFLSFHWLVFLWCGVCRTTAVCGDVTSLATTVSPQRPPGGPKEPHGYIVIGAVFSRTKIQNLSTGALNKDHYFITEG